MVLVLWTGHMRLYKEEPEGKMESANRPDGVNPDVRVNSVQIDRFHKVRTRF